jgi:UDP-N-acetylglucosamine transferase subunit ALG13
VDLLRIFVTTGTGIEYNFSRLLKILDNICEKGYIDSSQLIVQCVDNFIPTNFSMIRILSNDKFIANLEIADLVISHAGTGSVTKALAMGKKLIIFPRLEKFQEHGDNHQLDICNLFKTKGYALIALDENELINAINESIHFQPKPFLSNKSNFNKLLSDHIESFFKL